MKLKELQKKTHKTREVVAKEIGIKKSNYDNYLNGRNKPKLDDLIKISKYFNVSLDYLLEIKIEDTITEKQKQLIDIIKTIKDDNDLSELIGYAKGLINKEKPIEEKIKNLLKDYN